jgi:hypothetical protein
MLASEFSGLAAEEFPVGDTLCRVRFEAVVAETPKARLIQFDEVTKRWVPKSIIQGERIELWFLNRYHLRAFIIPWRQTKLTEEKKT